MSKWTTRRSGLEPPQLVLLGIAALGCAGGDTAQRQRVPRESALDATAPAAGEPASACKAPCKPTRDEEVAMRASLLKPVAESTQEAVGATPFRIELAAASRTTRGEPLITAVIWLYPESPTGARCQVALFFPKQGRAEIAAAPPAAELPGCRNLRLLSREDLNEDGIPDLAFACELPSNRYDVQVQEGRVYLSMTASSGVTYCWAPALDPLTLTSDDHGFHAAVKVERRRRGDHVLSCWQRTADAKSNGWILAPSR